MRINQNIQAFNAYRNLSTTNTAMGKSLEKLSSGFRINRAADDAAGLVISQGLRAQVSGLRQATRNSQDGISVVQTAEGALNEVHNMLNRMRDLSVQASNTASMDGDARAAAQNEITALSEEITRIGDKTQFGSTKLLDGSFGKTNGVRSGFDSDNSVTVAANSTFTVAVNGGAARTVNLTGGTYTGAQFAAHVESAVKAALAGGSADDQAAVEHFKASSEIVGAGSAVTFSNSGTTNIVIADGANTPLVGFGAGALIGTLSAATGAGASVQVGANSGDTIDVSIAAVSGTALGVNALDVANDASGAITAIDNAIKTVSTTRGQLGALQNRFESTIANLQVTTENLAASESRIRDTDMALEMVSFTRHQVLTQAGTSMLGQANQLPQGVLGLLRG